MIPGDINGVSGADRCAAHWRSLVDPTGCCSSRHPDSGSAGVSALEGEYRDVLSDWRAPEKKEEMSTQISYDQLAKIITNKK